MASGRQLAQENLDRFDVWKATKSDEDYKNMVFRGKLNRVELSKETGIGKSAFRQNPALSDALEELEVYLRDVGILPKAAVASAKLKSDNKTDCSAPARDKSASKVRALEAENNKLRTEVLELKAKLSRYSELEEVISSMGNIL
ncbi:VPA1267 family protein [Vibrio splendidus]|uniref:VPA1267 family protein n=1 Tax=Vibrio splendidus TaxID=29497 RepID=UPI002732CE60|nr:VPA1267 family protein [Vibrio splendidus]MDP2588246.1 VPA1267 family protein [Vibrio splendidus]